MAHLLIGPAAASGKVGFDLLLVAHVLCAVLGFGALVTTAIQAWRLGAVPVPTDGLRRYFAPGTNWAGRAIYGVPIFGWALLVDSGGSLRLSDAWAAAGLGLWATAALAAELVVWPAERRVQRAFAAADDLSGPPRASIARDAKLLVVLGQLLGAIFVAGTVLMVSRPG
ncbi:MAG: DUF2269 family protein [Acidimicrobiales bacterium]